MRFKNANISKKSNFLRPNSLIDSCFLRFSSFHLQEPPLSLFCAIFSDFNTQISPFKLIFVSFCLQLASDFQESKSSSLLIIPDLYPVNPFLWFNLYFLIRIKDILGGTHKHDLILLHCYQVVASSAEPSLQCLEISDHQLHIVCAYHIPFNLL